MAKTKQKPWESKAKADKDVLYAVKSLAKGGYLLVGGAKLSYGDWKQNVRGWEVKRKGLMENKECLCMPMDEYLGKKEVKEEAAPAPVVEVVPEPEVEESVPEAEEKPKKRRKKKKKVEDS